MDELIIYWKKYISGIENWQSIIKGITPKQTGCGPLYELPNLPDRPNESFAIADMRNIKYVEPHYHTNGDSEIQFVLQGSGLMVNNGVEERIVKGSVIIIPPEVAYFIIIEHDLVVAAINTPPFKPEDYIVVKESNTRVGFDKGQFKRLIGDL